MSNEHFLICFGDSSFPLQGFQHHVSKTFSLAIQANWYRGFSNKEFILQCITFGTARCLQQTWHILLKMSDGLIFRLQFLFYINLYVCLLPEVPNICEPMELWEHIMSILKTVAMVGRMQDSLSPIMRPVPLLSLVKVKATGVLFSIDAHRGAGYSFSW